MNCTIKSQHCCDPKLRERELSNIYRECGGQPRLPQDGYDLIKDFIHFIIRGL